MGSIYKIVPAELWREAEETGSFTGAPVDHGDGFIHFSTRDQVAGTAAKHFAGVHGLLLVEVDPEALRPQLRFEPSRGGDLFPHLYGPLPITAVIRVDPLPLDADGTHRLPSALAEPPEAGWVTEQADRFIELVGPLWTRQDGDARLFAFRATERHLNGNGTVHGGMLATFADEALGRTGYAATGGRRQATIQLDTQFLSAAMPGDLVVASCRVVRLTRSLIFIAGTISVGDRPVASATGVWKILGA